MSEAQVRAELLFHPCRQVLPRGQHASALVGAGVERVREGGTCLASPGTYNVSIFGDNTVEKLPRLPVVGQDAPPWKPGSVGVMVPRICHPTTAQSQDMNGACRSVLQREWPLCWLPPS